MELRKGAKFSQLRHMELRVVNYDKAEGRLLITILEVHSIAIGYKSVKIGNQDDSWILRRHGNKQSCTA